MHCNFEISASIRFCDKNTFSHSLTRMHLLQLQIWMGYFDTKKELHLGMNNKNHNSIVLYITVFNKTVCWYKILFEAFF